ncbi:MAG: tripartite tricarboxylate transporter TctB family protein [Pseudomonadota bacterium]
MNNNQKTIKAGTTIFAVLFLAFAVFLLMHLDTQTRYSSSGKLFAQPRFWPAAGVIGMSAFGLLYLCTLWREKLTGSAAEIALWIKAVEYLLWFMAYVWLVPIIGYLLATLIFIVLLSIRQGYRTRRQLLTAAATGLGIVLVFKTFLSVKIPGGAIYEWLPATLRNFMIVYF